MRICFSSLARSAASDKSRRYSLIIFVCISRQLSQSSWETLVKISCPRALLNGGADNFCISDEPYYKEMLLGIGAFSPQTLRSSSSFYHPPAFWHPGAL